MRKSSRLAIISEKIIKKGRPKGSRNKKGLVTDIIEDITKNDMKLIDKLVNLKDKLTIPEQSYIEIFSTGLYSREIALEMAGYGKVSVKMGSILARKIDEKHEEQAEDYRKIFRAIGLGELFVARGILDLCRTAKTPKEKHDAYALAAKVLKMPSEVLQVGGGIQIIMGVAPASPGAGSAEEAQEIIDLLPLPIKTLSITK